MLNKTCLFFLLLFIESVTYGNEPIDSLSYQNLYKQIEIFKLTNQKKYLHAIILNEISVLKNMGDSIKIRELKNLYLQSLINYGYPNEGLLLLDEIRASLNYADSPQMQEFYYWKGVAFRANNHYDTAKYYFDLAILECNKSNDALYLGRVCYGMGITFQLEGNRSLALPYYIKANILVANRSSLLSKVKIRISSTYALQKEYKLALKFINEAIDINTVNIGTDVNDRLVDYETWSSVLQTRSWIYREMAIGNTDSVFFLKKSLDDAKLSMELLERYKRVVFFESDMLTTSSYTKYAYFKTIEAISRLNKAEPNEHLPLDALRYAEMAKASALLRVIQKDIALKSSHIPDSLVHYLSALSQSLNEVEAKRFEENANVKVNDTALYRLNIEWFDLVSEITLLEKQLEKDYPIYEELKYKINPPNLDFILEESHNKAILEYVLSGEKLYAFLIVDGVVHFKDFYFRNDFRSSIERLQSMISDISKIEFSLKELNEFEELSYGLYKDLIEPFEALIGDKKLLIVPDEQLSLIPFEILLNKPSKSMSLNYSKLPYLVKTNDISYAYSLTLSNKQKGIGNKAENSKLLAMAPGYEKLAGNQGSQYIALRSAFRDARDKLGMLEGAQSEAKQVSKLVNGKLVVEDKASEAQFKLMAPKYRVLHLAMHTLVNNENPLYSKLVFTPDVDIWEDGLLNTYELGEMQLNADLVVLSACNTGFGKINNGEGIIGLSRGFLQAGCKSLLATLWSVADKASVALIEDYYDGLTNNKAKSASLSSAKRKYLSTATGMNAHPFFWAGYISIGDDDPIHLEKSNRRAFSHFILAGSLLLIIFGIIFYLKSRKGNSGFKSN